MKTYNRYKHCGETFYTGTDIEEIVCSECGNRIEHSDTVKTEKPVSDQENISITEIVRQNDTE